MALYKGEQSDIDLWEKLTIASTIGGMVINTAGVTLAHGMEHPASGLRDIVHGQGLAALTPPVIEATYDGRAREKFEFISKALGGHSASDCSDTIRNMLKTLDLDITLSSLGIKGEDIPWMSENCLKVSAGNLSNTPVDIGIDDIARIYEKAL